jgi:imidazolonepropionase-like amidohydrolase
MATINGAVALRRDSQIGTVERGKRADLVVLRANPLEDISNTEQIEWVIQGGRVFGQREILNGE